jgi:polyhydroxybutyrate depolymerase
VDIPRGLPRRPALVVVFHGLHESINEMVGQTGLDDVAARGKFVVAYPNALRGQRWPLNHQGGDGDVQHVSGLIDQLVARLCLDPHRVYATGFSNGAGFAARAGCELADRIAAIAPVSGSYKSLDRCPSSTRPMPTFEIHGSDPWLPTVPAFMAATARRNHCSAPPRTERIGRSARLTVWPGCGLRRVRVDGISHQWPNSSTGFAGSDAIWRFLHVYRR